MPKNIDIEVRGHLAICEPSISRFLRAQTSSYNPRLKKKVISEREIYEVLPDKRVVVGLGAILILSKNNPFIKFNLISHSDCKIPFRKLNNILESIPVKWRWYQKQALEIVSRSRAGLVEIPTAGGKTYCELATALAASKYSNVFIAVPTNILKLQISKTAEKLNIDLVNYEKTRKSKLENLGNIIIGNPIMISNDFKSEENRNLLDSIGTLIIDESHHSSCNTWQGLLSALPNLTRSIGFSATAVENRNKNFLSFYSTLYEDAMVYAATGSLLYSVEAKDIKEYIDCPDVISLRYKWPEKYTKYSHSTEVEVTRKLLKTNLERSEKISSIIDLLSRMNRSSITPVTEKVIGEEILNSCNNPETICWYGNGEIFDRTRTKIKEETALSDISKRKIRHIIPTQHMDEGLDIESIDTVILSFSRKKRRQIQRVGRGVRKGQVKSFVINLWDQNNAVLESQGRQRAKDITQYYGTKHHVVNSLEEVKRILES